MELEFDPEKSAANRAKHGIDFFEAQELWGDPKHLIVPARSTTEIRYALIGDYDNTVWVCIFTPRGEKLRIISVRRARNEEKEGYYQR